MPTSRISFSEVNKDGSDEHEQETVFENNTLAHRGISDRGSTVYIDAAIAPGLSASADRGHFRLVSVKLAFGRFRQIKQKGNVCFNI